MLKNSLFLLYRKLTARRAFLRNLNPLEIPGGRRIMTLSFDCDTAGDMTVIPALLAMLDEFHLKASFALCGELARAHGDAVKRLADSAHEIVNHGWSLHAGRDRDGAACSTLFYHDLAPERIEYEIEEAHRFMEMNHTITMKGFRTPHFSTFQKYEQRCLIYRILRRLGYLYSSSLCPGDAAIINTDGICEIPLTPCPVHRDTPFDSWHMLAAKGREHRDADLYRLSASMIAWAGERDSSFLFNLYFDPSQVIIKPALFRRFLALACSRMESLTYSELLALYSASRHQGS